MDKLKARLGAVQQQSVQVAAQVQATPVPAVVVKETVATSKTPVEVQVQATPKTTPNIFDDIF